MTEAMVMVHVRFAPDAEVLSIGERPGEATPQAWFDFLSERAAEQYAPLSGGRGLFRLSPDAIADLQSAFSEQGA